MVHDMVKQGQQDIERGSGVLACPPHEVEKGLLLQSSC